MSQFVRRHERSSNSVLIAVLNCDRDAFKCCAGDAVDVTANEFFLMRGISGFLNFWCGVPSNEGGVFNNCLIFNGDRKIEESELIGEMKNI